MTIFEKLREISESLAKGVKYPLLNQPNATFYICIEENLIGCFCSLWIEAGKTFPFSIRAAKTESGLDNCVVITIKDNGGSSIPFIILIKDSYGAKVWIHAAM